MPPMARTSNVHVFPVNEQVAHDLGPREGEFCRCMPMIQRLPDGWLVVTHQAFGDRGDGPWALTDSLTPEPPAADG